MFRTSLLSLFLVSGLSAASGMLPETSVVVIEEKSGEATVTLRNTDTRPLLLVTTVQDLPQDTESLIQVSPPAVRVEAGKTQTVRFLLTNKTPLKTERLKRVVFEGIPPKNKGENVVRVNISQNLPVVIRPAGLAPNNEPWKLLTWTYRNGALSVSNNSSYVVRLDQGVKTLPDNTPWNLGQPYILPAQTLTLTPDAKPGSGKPAHVRLSPATTWGFSVDSWDAPIN